MTNYAQSPLAWNRLTSFLPSSSPLHHATISPFQPARHQLACCMHDPAPESQAFLPQANRAPLACLHDAQTKSVRLSHARLRSNTNYSRTLHVCYSSLGPLQQTCQFRICLSLLAILDCTSLQPDPLQHSLCPRATPEPTPQLLQATA